MKPKLKSIYSDPYDLAFIYLERKGIPIKDISPIDVINAIVKIVNRTHQAGYRLIGRRKKK